MADGASQLLTCRQCGKAAAAAAFCPHCGARMPADAGERLGGRRLTDNTLQALALAPPGRMDPTRNFMSLAYVAGVVLRERERLARVFAAAGHPELAAAVLDGKDDRAVFLWAGPAVTLDAAAKVPAGAVSREPIR